MKKVTITAGAILMAVAWFVFAHQAAAETDDQLEISALESQLTKAVNAKDIDGVMAVYVPDESLFVFIDIIPPHQYEGARAYREHLEGFSSSSIT